jgi:enoyl-CoA hydratase/carnithine racemase
MTDHVLGEVTEGVQAIRFDRLEAENALTEAMCEAAANFIAFAESSSRVRVILMTGAPGIFTTGHDLAELQTFVGRSVLGESTIRLMKMIATVDKPVVAAVDGLAAGIGTALLLHCDYVIASEWSVFSAPYACIGLPPEAAASLLAPRLMGYHNAFALLVMGEHFDAHQAQRIGLVNRVVPAGEIETAGLSAAQALAAAPPEAVRMVRRLMRGDQREVVTRIDQEASGFSELLRSPAARDALDVHLKAKG